MYCSHMVHVVTSTLVLLPPFILATSHIHSEGVIGSRANDAVLNQYRADAVKSAFQTAWDGYEKYAFPHDELHPVTNTFGDSRYA
jgi:mannosyl-oligosaccharide alpha-1,2-mannosidase